MGIRGLLQFLRKNLGRNMDLIKISDRKFSVSRLYIDFPQMIYKALNELENPDDTTVIQKVIEKLINLLKELQPNEFLGIYFDGIPPLGKVVEQRSRRYEMQLKEEKFNRAKITVGTSFMTQLVKRVLEVIDDKIPWLPQEVVVSTIAEPGEGEHKIFNRIREKDLNLPGKKVIVSDDTDSTVMCLVNKLKDTFVYIDHRSEKHPPLNGLLDVDALSELVKYKLRNRSTAIHDFVLMVLLTGGNDFTPWMQAARNRIDLLTLMIDIYLMNGELLPLTYNDGKDILWEGVRKLMTKVAEHESRLIKNLIETTKGKLVKIPAIYSNAIDARTGLFDFEMFKQGWNEEVYRIRSASPIIVQRLTKKDIEADHDYMATEFLTGVKWFYNYMRTGTGPDWYYKPSVIPPLLVDLARVLSQGTDPTKNLLTYPTPWQPLNLSVYLLIILPERSARDLLDIHLQKAYQLDSGLLDLFPAEFETFGPGETRAGVAKAILPPLEIDRITKWVSENIPKGSIESNISSLGETHRYSKRLKKWFREGMSKESLTPTASDKPNAKELGYEICELVVLSV